MTAALNGAQRALKLALSGLAGGRVHDDAPSDVAYPWIEIGDRQIIPDDVQTEAGGGDDGLSDSFDLHVWGRGRAGKKEVNDLAEAIHAALHGRSLAVAGRASAHAWVRNVRIVRDPDGITQHGVVTVEIVHRS